MPDAPSNPAPTNGDAPTIRAGGTAAAPVGRRRGLTGSPSTPNRVVAWFRGWTRRNMGREQMTAFLKTLLWVGPLTALIWIYAERQQVDKRPQVTRPVEVVLNDPTKIVRIIKPIDKNVVLTLQGPKAALDKFTDQGGLLAGNPPLRIVLDGKATDGTTTIKTILVGLDKRFVDAGITVLSAVPEEIEVLIDPIVEVDAKVVSDDPTVRAAFTPPTVKVRGPRSVVRPDERERDNSALVVKAGLKERLAQGAAAAEAADLPGVKLSVDLNDPNVAILPPVASARVEKERLSEYEIPAVRVVVSATPTIWNAYTIDLPDGKTINKVGVIGPEEQVRTLRPSTNTQETRPLPKATVEITEVPAAGSGEVVAKLKYDLPPNVRAPNAPTEVRVILTPR